MKNIFLSLLVLSSVVLCPSIGCAALDLDKLSEEDIKRSEALIAKLAPLIEERNARQDLSRLTFAELYAPLNEEERSFLEQFKNLDPKAVGVKIPFRGFATGEEPLTVITGQRVKDRSKPDENIEKELPPQFLPPNVYEAYLKMMDAMQKDIGKTLLIESGYRSSAYQLYLFVYYLKNHEYSIRETAGFVALPGFSEHGAPAHQAIDFINVDGINGEDDPQEFEDLPEYAWLLEHAPAHGFVLSYPKSAGNGITYEPWHWRYEPPIEQ